MPTLNFSVSPSDIYDEARKLLDLAGIRGKFTWDKPSMVFLDHESFKAYIAKIQTGEKPPRVIIVISRQNPSKEDLKFIGLLRDKGVKVVSFIDPDDPRSLDSTLRYFLLPLATIE